MPAAHGRWPPSRSGERAGSRPTERFDANVTPTRARVKRLPLLSRATPPHRRGNPFMPDQVGHDDLGRLFSPTPSPCRRTMPTLGPPGTGCAW